MWEGDKRWIHKISCIYQILIVKIYFIHNHNFFLDKKYFLWFFSETKNIGTNKKERVAFISTISYNFSRF